MAQVIKGQTERGPASGYRVGSQPNRYGCREYSLEMQLLQLRRRQQEVQNEPERSMLENRIREIEEQLGM